MSKRPILSLAISLFFVFASLMLPHSSQASTLFLDQFNGSGELHSYNNAYIKLFNSFGNVDMDVATDHLVLNTTIAENDSEYLYTGLQAADNQCASIDFKQDSSKGTWNTATELFLNTSDGNPNNEIDRVDIRSGS